MQKLDREKLTSLIKETLGAEYITHFVIDLPDSYHITVMVKTTTDFIWGDRFCGEDSVSQYLRELGYGWVLVNASNSIEGGEVSASGC